MSVVAKAVSMLKARPSRRTIGPIGIDFGLEAVHLVQLAAAPGEAPSVHARASIAYDGPRREVLRNSQQFRDVMRRALAADGFYGRRAVIAIPAGMFRTVSVNFQSGSGKDQEAAAVLRVMKERLDGNLEDYVLDYLPVSGRSKNDERLALVAVSERTAIVEFLELARKARFEVEALEIGPVAISRLVGELSLESGSDNVLVINSGREASYLTVISGAELLFDQQVSFGENGLIQQTAETLDMSESMARDLILRSGVCSGVGVDAVTAAIDEAGIVSTISEILKPQFLKLVEEIKRVCLYAASETRGGAIKKVYLLGSIARWPGSDHLLGTLTGFDVAKIPNPLALFPSSDAKEPAGIDNTAPEIVVATGAALRGM